MGKALAMTKVRRTWRTSLGKCGIEDIGGSLAKAMRVRIGKSVEIVQGKNRSRL